MSQNWILSENKDYLGKAQEMENQTDLKKQEDLKSRTDLERQIWKIEPPRKIG